MIFSLKSKPTGQAAYGYVEVYQNDEPKGKRSAAIVYYMPEGFNEHPNARVSITVLTGLPNNSITDGTFHEIMDDMVDIVKANASQYFKHPENAHYMDTCTLHISNIDGLSEFNHGDYGF